MSIDYNDVIVGEFYYILFIDPADDKIYNSKDYTDEFKLSVPKPSIYMVKRKRELKYTYNGIWRSNHSVIEFSSIEKDYKFEIFDGKILFVEDSTFTKFNYFDIYDSLLNKESSSLPNSHIFLNLNISSIPDVVNDFLKSGINKNIVI